MTAHRGVEEDMAGYEGLFKHKTSTGYFELHRWAVARSLVTQQFRDEDAEIFKLGEPVALKSVRDEMNPSGIWWIQAFLVVESLKKIMISPQREAGGAELGVPYWEIEKLNAMERLAAEYSDP
jgi:hypothetical protein